MTDSKSAAAPPDSWMVFPGRNEVWVSPSDPTRATALAAELTQPVSGTAPELVGRPEPGWQFPVDFATCRSIAAAAQMVDQFDDAAAVCAVLGPKDHGDHKLCLLWISPGDATGLVFKFRRRPYPAAYPAAAPADAPVTWPTRLAVGDADGWHYCLETFIPCAPESAPTMDLAELDAMTTSIRSSLDAAGYAEHHHGDLARWNIRRHRITNQLIVLDWEDISPGPAAHDIFRYVVTTRSPRLSLAAAGAGQDGMRQVVARSWTATVRDLLGTRQIWATRALLIDAVHISLLGLTITANAITRPLRALARRS